MRKITTTRSMGLLVALVALILAAAACSSEDNGGGNGDNKTTTTAESQDQTGQNTTIPTTSQQAGGFKLTTADGKVEIAGTATDCKLIDDSSAKITFSGSVQEVNVDASGGTGSVTVDSEFEGTIETAAVDTDTGDVRITGEAAATSDGTQATKFEVEGRCEL